MVDQYSPSNPHPNFGKDTNIGNEYGHTTYPKMVYPSGKPSVSMSNRHPGEAGGVVVNSKEEEDKVMNMNKADDKANKPDKKSEDKKADDGGWNK